VDARSAVLTARDLAKGSTVDVTWAAPPAWVAALAAKPDALILRSADDQGNPQGPPLAVSGDALGLLLPALSADQPYVISCATCPASAADGSTRADGSSTIAEGPAAAGSGCACEAWSDRSGSTWPWLVVPGVVGLAMRRRKARPR